MRKKSSIKNCLNASKKFDIDVASEKRASCWLNAMPLKKHSYNLSKSELQDGIALRYD